MTYVGRDKDYEEPLSSASAMWTDLYELTMAQALMMDGKHELYASFHAYIRETPFNAAYLVSAGQNIIFEWLDKNWRFTDRDIRRLAAKMVANPENGRKTPLFNQQFLDMLQNAELKLSLDAMPEGEIAFASEPIYRVSGPLWQCLLVETAILNTMNSQSNFATLASILKNIAGGRPVLEFGARRSQAVGALSSSRGTYIGGIDFSSNCWAESVYGIETKGTMAHALIMAYESELEAFNAWAEHMPYTGMYLVDTYNTLEGVKRAIQVCHEKNIKLVGIRLDSGDLNYFSVEARKLLDKAGFKEAQILVSNDLDAAIMNSLIEQGAPIDAFAVGTNLATAKDQPALGGVYKLGSIADPSLSYADILTLKEAVKSGAADPKDIRKKIQDMVKISSDSVKTTLPGELDVIRYLEERNGQLFFNGSTIYPEWSKDPITLSDPEDLFSGRLNTDITSVRRGNMLIGKKFSENTKAYRPLQRIFSNGKLISDIETVHIARNRAKQRLTMLDSSHRRLLNPHEHVVGIEEKLLERQIAMANELRQSGDAKTANLL
jgi:nicotinate phosphoribosyltransferase